MNDKVYRPVGGEAISAEEVSAEEARLLAGGRGSLTSKALMEFVQNPSALASMFSLTEGQAVNVRAAISGMGTAAAVKYLSKSFGTEIAAIIGAAASAYAARKAFGG